MEESKKGHNLVDISLNSLKSKSSRLNIDPNPYEKISESYLKRFSRYHVDKISLLLQLQSRKRGITQSLFLMAFSVFQMSES